MQQSTTTEIPLVQAGFFNPILKRLEAAGASTATLLRSASLHRFDVSNTENYVPLELMYRLFEEIRHREGVDDFFEVFAEHIRAQGMCDWLDVVAYSPDVLSALSFAAEYENVVLTHQRIQIEIDGPVCRFSMRYVDQPKYLGLPHWGFNYTDYADTCLAVNFFKQVGGPDWAPLELHLQSLEAPNIDTLLQAGQETKIYLGQPATTLVFPTSMLAIPLENRSSPVLADTFEDYPRNLSGIIDKLFCSAQDGQIANLGLVADMLGMSSRTLRRRLLDEGTTFSEIVDTWRFKSSLDLLGQAGTRINEISERLGYANAPNFERAFKRWTGQTPGAYRQALS